jgi:beta-lactam-binding protein with PASTA domain
VPRCNSVMDCAEALAEAGFQSTTVRVRSAERAGAFVATSPARGGRAVPGQVVSILVSNGADYVEPAPETSAPPPPPPEETPPPEPAETTAAGGAPEPTAAAASTSRSD